MIFASWFLLAALSTAAVLDPRQSLNSKALDQLSDRTAHLESITDLSLSTASALLEKRRVPKAHCGALIDPRLISSCRDAFDFLPNTGPVISFGQRVLKGRVNHVMPFFVLDSKGLCAISINITEPLVQKEEETVERVAEALNEVFAQCILADPPRAGTVSGMGTSHTLSFSIDAPKLAGQTQIQCFNQEGAPLSESGCAKTLDLVPYNFRPQFFGPSADPRITVDLPQAWKETPGRTTGCGIVLSSIIGGTVQATWAQVWMMGAVVNAVCVRQGQSGAIRCK
ncbi:MAG: hypothetical protein LQ350_006915 [Teloschistes chrysophthalmus]|nr:MAG: hypothetical protein LQ350_006915 [Niorma chrysophthalma]